MFRSEKQIDQEFLIKIVRLNGSAEALIESKMEHNPFDKFGDNHWLEEARSEGRVEPWSPLAPKY